MFTSRQPRWPIPMFHFYRNPGVGERQTMDTLLVAIASVAAITILSAALSGMAAFGRRLGMSSRSTADVEPGVD